MATKPLYGDPANQALVWSKYAVLLGSLTATVPATNVAFTLNDPAADPVVSAQWDPVGALDADTPWDDGTESVDPTDHTAAGFGVYATTFKNQKELVAFAMKETTLVTMGILYDASGVTDTTGTLSGTLKQRDPSKKFLIGFQRENGATMERRISKNFAYIDSISRAFNNDESLRTVTVAIIPNASKELYSYYKGPLAS